MYIIFSNIHAGYRRCWLTREWCVQPTKATSCSVDARAGSVWIYITNVKRYNNILDGMHTNFLFSIWRGFIIVFIYISFLLSHACVSFIFSIWLSIGFSCLLGNKYFDLNRYQFKSSIGINPYAFDFLGEGGYTFNTPGGNLSSPQHHTYSSICIILQLLWVSELFNLFHLIV